MGGTGSGGARVGSGQKPKDAAKLSLHGGRDRRKPNPPVDPPSPPVAVDPPGGIPDKELAVWRELAPLALAAKTLTPQTAGSFADLCRVIVFRNKLFADIADQGTTYLDVSVDGAGVEHQAIKKNPTLTDLRGWEQRVEAGRARFKLAPVGKEISGTEKPKDEWAEFDDPNVNVQ